MRLELSADLEASEACDEIIHGIYAHMVVINGGTVTCARQCADDGGGSTVTCALCDIDEESTVTCAGDGGGSTVTCALCGIDKECTVTCARCEIGIAASIHIHDIEVDDSTVTCALCGIGDESDPLHDDDVVPDYNDFAKSSHGFNVQRRSNVSSSAVWDGDISLIRSQS